MRKVMPAPLGWFLVCALCASCASQPPATGPQASSFEKIDAAQAGGKLDGDTAILYRLYALFDPQSLPRDYAGDDSHLIREGTHEVGQAYARVDAMTAALQAKIRPFLLRPTDPASFWAQVQPPPTTTQGLGTASDPPGWASADSADGKTRVWYGANNAKRGTSAALLAAEIQGIFAKEVPAMLGHTPCDDGDGVLDVYLIPPLQYPPRDHLSPDDILKLGEEGLTVPQKSTDAAACPLAAFVILDPAIGDGKMQNANLAHELFHVLQNTFPSARHDDHHWFAEATATWAEDLVYPTFNLDAEQKFLEDVRSSWSNLAADGPLDGDNGAQPYSAYVFPFYLTRGRGLDPSFIGMVWEGSASKPPLETIADAPWWTDAFKEFALWNWNQDPVVHYDDGGKILPLQQKSVDHEIYNGDDLPIDAHLDHVSVHYEQIILDGAHPHGLNGVSNVTLLTLDLSALAGNPMAAVQGIVTISGQAPKPYDWTGLDQVKWCRDKPDEKVESIVLVLSNADIAQPLAATLHARTSPSCAPLGGTFKFDGTHTGALDSNGGIVPSGSFSFTLHVESTWTLEKLGSTGDVTNYRLTSVNDATFSGDSTASLTNAGGTVHDSEHITGSGRTHNPPQPGEFDGANPYESGLVVRGNSYEINWDMSRIATQRDYTRTTTENVPQLDGSICVATETGHYDESLPGYVGQQSGCGADQAVSIPDPYGPPRNCGPVIPGGLTGTFDPSVGKIHVDTLLTDADCNSDAAGACYEPYYKGGVQGPSTCTNSYHIVYDLQLPPK
jgi:hypothetical protein